MWWRERRSDVEGGWNGEATLIMKRCDGGKGGVTLTIKGVETSKKAESSLTSNSGHL